MIDQVESLRKRGVSAAILSGNEGVERSFLERPVSTWQVQLAVYIPWTHCFWHGCCSCCWWSTLCFQVV